MPQVIRVLHAQSLWRGGQGMDTSVSWLALCVILVLGIGLWIYLRGRKPVETAVFHFRCPDCGRRLRYRPEALDDLEWDGLIVARDAGDERVVSITEAGEAWLRMAYAPC